ncbi:MAG: hypothetical protein LBM12_00600 [Candidatus Nomurabacteria bacterium]|jgi:hypothetical protein|nr:hypothetical protein [Candidatus Nomurabacteria bacterium]
MQNNSPQGNGLFEINLVPQIKRDALRTQKIRNLVIAGCILVGATCGILLAIFGTTFAVQKAITANRTEQIKENHAKLQGLVQDDKYDLQYYLTIQNQLKELGEIGQQKSVFSRVLGIVSDVVPRHPQTGEPTIQFTELNYNVTSYRVSFDAQSIYSYEALNALKATMERLYYDYGYYTGPDGNEIQVEREDIDTEADSPTRGIIYGITRAQDGSEIRIYRDGRDYNGFKFESQCLLPDGVTSSCKLIPDESVADDELPTLEVNSGGAPTLRFKMSFDIDPGALNMQHRFVRVLGIPRQTVTDSYLQINNNWFAAAPTTEEEE